MFAEARTACLALALALGSGCLGSAPARPTARARTPSFVLIDADVWVMESSSEPIFYTDGYYWRFGGGAWYRSPAYDRGWVTVTVAPDWTRRIDRPTRYVRYVGPPAAPRRVGPPAHARAQAAPPHERGKPEKGHHKDGKGGKKK